MTEYPVLLRHLAEQEDLNAQYNLALMYLHGKGVEKSLKEALHWLSKAAERGSSDAQLLLGLLYAETQKATLAFRWLSAAAHQDCATAEFYLGMMYRDGKGTEKDLRLAKAWLQKAADQEHPEAKQVLDKLESLSQNTTFDRSGISK